MDGLPKIGVFRWRGVPVYLDVTFLLVPLVLFPWRLIPDLASLGWGEAYVFRPLGIWLIAVAGTFASILIHELAHVAVARRYHIQASAIQIGGFYGLAIMPVSALLRRWIVPILAAGPVANLAIAGCIWIVLGMPEVSSRLYVRVARLAEPGAGFQLQPFWISGLIWLFQLNVAMAIYNLLPAFPLDGGRMIRLGLRQVWRDERAVRFVAGCGVLVGLWSVLGGIGLGAAMITAGLMIAVYNIAIWRYEVDAPDD